MKKTNFIMYFFEVCDIERCDVNTELYLNCIFCFNCFSFMHNMCLFSFISFQSKKFIVSLKVFIVPF